MGLEKKPFSLTDAKFSLWLASPEQWQLRLEAHPSRTDTAATDTGHHAPSKAPSAGPHTSPRYPSNSQASGTAAPLGAVTWILLGRDAGLRGEMTVRTSVHGTLGSNQVDSKFELRQVRRADFVPVHTLEADLTCKGQANGIFHQVGPDPMSLARRTEACQQPPPPRQPRFENCTQAVSPSPETSPASSLSPEPNPPPASS